MSNSYGYRVKASWGPGIWWGDGSTLVVSGVRVRDWMQNHMHRD